MALEYFDGNSWQTIPDLNDVVTSVGISTNTTGLSVSNTPITSSGVINIDLSDQLQNLSDITSLGILIRTGQDTFSTIENGTNGQILTIDSNDMPVWATPSSGGNVTGSGASVLNSLPKWNNTNCTGLEASDILIDSNNILQIPSTGKLQTKYIENISSGQYIQCLSPLHVQSYVTEYRCYGYLNQGGNTGTGCDTVNYGIKVDNRVLAQEFNAYSSINIKNVISDNPNELLKEALSLFDKIQPVKYSYKDYINYDQGEFFGIIAEDLQKILPHYVHESQNFAPNIFSMAQVTCSDNDTYVLNLKNIKNFDVQINKNDKIQIEQKDCLITAKVLSFNNTNKTILISTNTKLQNEVFVYGTYTDTPNVAYNKLLGLMFVAQKAMYNTLKKEISVLKQKLKK